jgi:hypothetical protein
MLLPSLLDLLIKQHFLKYYIDLYIHLAQFNPLILKLKFILHFLDLQIKQHFLIFHNGPGIHLVQFSQLIQLPIFEFLITDYQITQLSLKHQIMFGIL